MRLTTERLRAIAQGGDFTHDEVMAMAKELLELRALRDDLTHLRALPWDQIVPRPWTYRPSTKQSFDGEHVISDANDIIIADWLTENEARVIVAAVNALPGLLERVEDSEADSLRLHREKMAEWHRAEAAEDEVARLTAQVRDLKDAWGVDFAAAMAEANEAGRKAGLEEAAVIAEAVGAAHYAERERTGTGPNPRVTGVIAANKIRALARGEEG